MSNNVSANSRIIYGNGNNFNLGLNASSSSDDDSPSLPSVSSVDDSSFDEDSSSIDLPCDDLKRLLELAEIENSIPFSHLFNDENSYSTSEWIVPSEEMYEESDPVAMRDGPLKLLNGKLIHHPIPDDATEQLRENLKTAKKIIRFVQSTVPFSTNYLQRSKIFSSNLYDDSSCRSIARAVDRTLGVLREENKGSGLEPLEQTVGKIVSFKTGNCSEMSLTGLLLSYAKNQQSQNCAEMFDGGFDEVQKGAPIEVVEIAKPQGDHVFLVIDRDQRFLPSCYYLWGPNAVVCDVWSGAHYPASKVDDYLLDYVTDGYIKRIPCPLVQNFDPSRQTVEVFTPFSIQ